MLMMRSHFDVRLLRPGCWTQMQMHVCCRLRVYVPCWFDGRAVYVVRLLRVWQGLWCESLLLFGRAGDGHSSCNTAVTAVSSQATGETGPSSSQRQRAETKLCRLAAAVLSSARLLM